MNNYIEQMKKDLLEQFRGKENIEALVEVFAMELQQVYSFLKQLREERNIKTAVGKQLDGIGDIVDMSREDVLPYLNDFDPPDVLTDEIYRQYLIYKILKNTCDCTYKDVINAFKMFWDRPLYYKEDPEQPATMIFDTGEMEGLVDTRSLFRTPPIRAAGVTLKLYARTKTKLDTAKAYIISGLGYAVTITNLPVYERDYQYDGPVHIGSNFATSSQDQLPISERDYRYKGILHAGGDFQSIAHSPLPPLRFNLNQIKTSGRTVHSVMETPMSEIKPKT